MLRGPSTGSFEARKKGPGEPNLWLALRKEVQNSQRQAKKLSILAERILSEVVSGLRNSNQKAEEVHQIKRDSAKKGAVPCEP